jgi:hypothetical protein
MVGWRLFDAKPGGRAGPIVDTLQQQVIGLEENTQTAAAATSEKIQTLQQDVRADKELINTAALDWGFAVNSCGPSRRRKCQSDHLIAPQWIQALPLSRLE